MRSEAAELTPFLVKRLETYFILHMRCMSSKDFDLCMFISNYHRKGLCITDQVLHLITTMTKNKRLRIIKCLVTQKFQSINLVWKNCLQHSQWIGTYVFLYPNYYKYKNIKVFLCFVHFPFSQPPKIHNKEYKHYLMSKTQYLTSAVYRLCNGSLSHYHDGDLSPRPHLSWSCLGCGHSRLCYPAGPGPLAADTCSNPETRHVYTIYILIVLSERP